MKTKRFSNKMQTRAYVKLLSMLLLTSALLTSCFSDESTAWNQTVGDIEIGGIENSYVKTAYVGEHLIINPVVNTDYSDADMEYKWMLVDGRTGTIDEIGDTIQPRIIGTQKNLDYEVNISPGQYQLRLYATAKSNKYTAIAYATLTVQTNFSQGFYILKETVDGNTELELLDRNGRLTTDLLQAIYGRALSGKPVNLCTVYDLAYINPDNDEMETVNTLLVATDRDFNVLRTTDLSKIFDRTNLLFEEMPADECVYGLFQAYMNSVLVTSHGLYTRSGGGTGQFGLPDSECSPSVNYYHDFTSYGGGACWDSHSHSLMGFDYYMSLYPLTDKSMGGEDLTQNLTGYDCLYCGFNFTDDAQGQFILRDGGTGNRYLYLTSGGFFGQYLTVYKKFAAGSHMATAEHYACNGVTASYIYCVDGGKLYACVINSDNMDEVELTPAGIPAGERINYVANQFWAAPSSGAADNFDYLIVGTQTGDSYKLYFYETNGGVPVGQPVMTTTGQGRISKVRYLNTTYRSSYLSYGYHVYNPYD